MTTSRQRVMMAVNHQEPDRIPIDLGGHRSSGISAIAYRRLKEHLGIESGDIYVYDMVQQLAIIEPEVLDHFGVDTVELGRGFALLQKDWRDWVLPDGTPCKIPAFIEPTKVGGDWQIRHEDGTLIAIQKEGCLYFEQTCWPLASSDDVAFDDLEQALEKVMWSTMGTPPAPIGFDGAGLAQLASGAARLRASNDRAIIGLFGGNLLETGQFLFGIEGFFLLLAGDPARAHRFLDRLVELHLRNLDAFLSAVGPYIDIILFGDDLGMQTGPQISPRMYREFFYPRHKLMWQAAKDKADVKVMLHSCGGLYPLLPHLIEAGLDIIQPVQTTARDMEPAKLKREFGLDLCLWGGGCNTQKMLTWSTPAEVARDVTQRLQLLAPGGGYVFQQIHNILANVPSENIVAMLDAVHAYSDGLA
ncbi:MAG TPA: uroporphyrinogen decarboxylase family protein [Anaerolineae bacterium]|nr:uroporphyrinogen decarboxylase family protein [Anaerolineae bacterium]